MKIKKLIAAFLSATVLATSIAPVFAINSAANLNNSSVVYVADGESAAAAVTLTVNPNAETNAESNTYKTIREAVAKAKELNPQSEEERVTINVNPGYYEEQVMIDSMKYLTVQKTPDTEGDVVVAWYYCTGYTAGNVDLNGFYDPTINWSDSRTWTGYNDGDEQFTAYELGACLTCTGDGSAKVDKISYYDTNGVAHKDVPVKTSHLGSATALSQMATCCIRGTSEYITVKDIKFINSIPAMVTNGEKEVGVAPEHCREYGIASSYQLPFRDALSVCNYYTTTEEKPTADIFDSNGAVNIKKFTEVTKQYVEEGKTFTPGESLWLCRSSILNERGHAVAYVDKADKIIFDGITLVGNQDSLYAAGRRAYFTNCDIIGGTDYIYGGGTAVFDNCKLGLAGFSDKSYGSPIAVGGHSADRIYGYLFNECTLYNVRTNNGTNNYGGPWQTNSQVTYYNCIIDDNGTVGNSKFVLDAKGWCRFGAENGLSKSYEYGTKNISGKAVDFSKRVVNKSVEDGGPGMGTVLDEWQILEFNPRNYFAQSCDKAFTDSWDPTNFAETYLKEVDAAIAGAGITIPENEETTFDLPKAPEGIAFKWQSASTNAQVSEDGTKLTVLRPAAGETNINTTVTLYAMNTTTKYGDKKEIPVVITPTTNTTDVFNMPTKVTTTAALATDNDYTVTISKNGAVIKKVVIKVPAGQTEATTTIENIPATADGIDYDVRVVSTSNDISIVSPADGKMTVKGITGQDVSLNIKGESQVYKTIDTGISYSSSEGNKNFDLISLVKANGGNNFIKTSDTITIEYKLDVTPTTTGNSFIDILAGTPTASATANGASVPSRFVYSKLGHWNQLDTIDVESGGFSGSSNTEHQWLNAAGKFKDGVSSTIKVVIDFKNSKITMYGRGSNNKDDSYSFAGFPSKVDRDKLYMAIYQNKDTFSISDVKVTYKEVVGATAPTDVPEPTETPKPTATPTPTTKPTETPVDPEIVSAKAENGNTVVTLKGIKAGTVIAAKFDGKVLKDIKYVNISGETVTVNGIEATNVFVWESMENAKPLCPEYKIINSSQPIETEKPTENATAVSLPHVADFTAMTAVPVYSDKVGSGFTNVSGAIRAKGYERKVDPTAITISADGASITESTGNYLYKNTGKGDGDDYNHGGMIYRVYTGKPGAYKLEVEVTDASNVKVAPTGMDGGRITGTGTWDNAGLVPKNNVAAWNENVWTYNFATGENFVEIEIEPSSFPTADKPQTVGVKSIKVTEIPVNEKDGKPTIHILGDSTQKTYTFNEQISSWGQTLVNYFNTDKVNVINYSMGGRSMKANYSEGRSIDPIVNGKKGDFVFIHSAHNDETVSTNRFSRGAGVSSDLATNNESYNRWLDMYVEMIKARGMTPVLVTAMPRTGGGVYSESAQKPNGFSPDAPGNMRAKAASDPSVGLVELYAGTKDYFAKIDAKEVMFIYNNYEAGETPANNYANGGSSDGTHYREGASKQFNRIMLQSIYDQSVATDDKYTDKAIMAELVTYMKDEVQNGAKTGDWSAAFPEMASDVSAVDIVPGAEKQATANYYYRNNIEKALQVGLLSKDKNNMFKPTEAITVGEFARSVEKVFGLEENALTNYTKTSEELKAKVAEEEVAELCSEDYEAVLSGETATVTVTQADGGEITVYNNSAYHTSTTDIGSNVKADSVIADNEYYTLTAPSEIVAKNDKNGVFTNKEVSTSAIEVRNNGTKQIKYSAKADGIFTAYLMFVDHKTITMENKTDSKTVKKYINNTDIKGETKANQYSEVTFEVEKDKEYEFYTDGGTGRLFGIMYASTDYPQSTESLEVNVGDEVRITAYADTNYVNGNILVNGESKTNGKEYKFKVTGDTTVTATFIAEPKLVEETIIPTDAALTREAMAAIIYDAYVIADAANPNGNWHIYFGQNGGVPSPDDPNYDPNIKYEGQPYIPLTGWGALTDKGDLSNDLYAKVKTVYNLGMIRSEQGIARGSVACGNVLEPKTVVTRAKAAKALTFMYILTQPTNGENQFVPAGRTVNVVDEIALPTDGVAALPVK